MSNVTVAPGVKVDPNDFWVDSGTTSTNEQFVNQTDIEGNLVLGIGQVTATYNEFRFDAGQFTYRYIGDWTMDVDGGALSATTSAEGTYDKVIIEKNGEFYASLDLDKPLSVDFGTESHLDILGLGTDALTDPLLALLFGNGGEEPVDNLHLGATPDLTDLVDINGGGGPGVQGTDSPETINGQNNDDVINAMGGDDVVHGRGGNDSIHGGDGNDQLSGDAGNDKLYGDAGNDILRGGPGQDRIWGGRGEDMIFGAAANDRLRGGADDDHIVGGKGHDVMWGGGGADVFDFNFASQSTNARSGRDLIKDFTHQDTIDVHTIDADKTHAGNQDFDFIGRQQFHDEAGELRFARHGSDTFIYGDVNGDGKADFTIQLDDGMKLTASDFML